MYNSPGAFRSVSRRWSSVARAAGAPGPQFMAWSYSPARASMRICFFCAGLVLEVDGAVDRGKDAVVMGKARARAGLERHAALPDDDRPGGHELAVASLRAQALADAVAAVLGTGACLLVGHRLFVFLWSGRPAWESRSRASPAAASVLAGFGAGLGGGCLRWRPWGPARRFGGALRWPVRPWLPSPSRRCFFLGGLAGLELVGKGGVFGGLTGGRLGDLLAGGFGGGFASLASAAALLAPRRTSVI